ncbi:MAG: N-6 DNA methylase [Polyangiaceae bacterium]|nr:N-6 DNA methylase [Polyangiaceae bacterium]
MHSSLTIQPNQEPTGLLYSARAAQLIFEFALRLVELWEASSQARARQTLEESRLARLAQKAPAISEEELQGLKSLLAPVEEQFTTILRSVGERSYGPRLKERRDVAHLLGHAYDLLNRAESKGSRSGDPKVLRRSAGSYFTSAEVAQSVIRRTLSVVPQDKWSALGESVVDPAVGGGSFLIEAFVELSQQQDHKTLEERRTLAEKLHGVDVEELAVCVAELALWVLVGDPTLAIARPAQFVIGDALEDRPWQLMGETPLGRDRQGDGLDLSADGHAPLPYFSWVVGNPPWVSFQGRAAQPLEPQRRKGLKERYAAFSGYPTLHGVFLERATQLTPQGVISLLLPSSLSDLRGYRFARAALLARHLPAEPLLEYGQDAFAGVVQPCFGLIAQARETASGVSAQELANPVGVDAERIFVLEERARSGEHSRVTEVPSVLQRLAVGESLPANSFRELGFQSNPRVREAMFVKAETAPTSEYEPLLAGRNVGEFLVRPPRLFVRPEPEVLRATRCRYRDISVYEDCPVIIRQTAAYPIAALAPGIRFRNSLIGGYATESVSARLLVCLLNSSLYRALHVAGQRDARQATFPQVKLAHLRALPLPPGLIDKKQQVQELEALTSSATQRGGVDLDERRRLDRLVYELFQFTEQEMHQVDEFLEIRLPRAKRPSLSA